MSESQWHEVCQLSELSADSGREFVFGGNIVAIFLVEGRVYAVDGMCAHQGGPIAQGKLNRTCITCPWHGWQYDICNGNNLLTGKQMLTSYETEIRKDSVWILI